jgi:hypothetical protein
MTPRLPEMRPPSARPALEIPEKSAALASQLDPMTMQSLIDFSRITNTCYPNLIEDHNTHPVDMQLTHRIRKSPHKCVGTASIGVLNDNLAGTPINIDPAHCQQFAQPHACMHCHG